MEENQIIDGLTHHGLYPRWQLQSRNELLQRLLELKRWRQMPFDLKISSEGQLSTQLHLDVTDEGMALHYQRVEHGHMLVGQIVKKLKEVLRKENREHRFHESELRIIVDTITGTPGRWISPVDFGPYTEMEAFRQILGRCGINVSRNNPALRSLVGGRNVDADSSSNTPAIRAQQEIENFLQVLRNLRSENKQVRLSSIEKVVKHAEQKYRNLFFLPG